jgi:hypothetical protein
MLTESNAFERAKRLEIPGNRHTFAEKLDADVVQRSLSPKHAQANMANQCGR